VLLLQVYPTPPNTSEWALSLRVKVSAYRRNGTLANAADYAKHLPLVKQVLLPPTEIMVNGHQFVRVDVLHDGGGYHSNLATVCGDYLVLFDFSSNSETELHSLTETIRTIRFE
jgi:hypothetical protein